ncbi:MAG: demethylmenaquinone methyltransferase [Promicromonosporaceae bacterium]|nr:demethylmenaquinone methyltransferase [Promicromonosporaceae bacterium]
MVRATLSKQPGEVAAMFDGIARRYDLVNSLASLGQDRRWRRAVIAALAPQPGEQVLDVAAGTGTSTTPIAAAGAHVVPCDISPGMIAEGKRRRPDLPFTLGDATALPFADGTFDAVTISFGLRNVADTSAALREMLRVTRPGGRLLVCEFSTPTWAPLRVAYRDCLLRALPVAAGAVTRDRGSYDYLAESIRAWPNQLALAAQIQATGWCQVAYRNLTGGIVALHRASRAGDGLAS